MCLTNGCSRTAASSSRERIAAAFTAAGVDLDKPIITSCGSGVTAAILTFALESIGKDRRRASMTAPGRNGARGPTCRSSAIEHSDDRHGEAKPVALVTGGANGIGRAIARHLLDAGWRVGIIDLPDSGLQRAFPPRNRNVVLHRRRCRARKRPCRARSKTLVERFGRLDAVVSNAGIMIRKPLRRLTLAEWHRVIDTNLTAAFLLARAAERPLRKARGAIVIIASTRALMSEPNTESYSASKGGLVALTHALAISLGPDVRVNCVSPGWIATKNYGALRRKDHAQHPAGRVGKPQDIAEIVALLLDAQALRLRHRRQFRRRRRHDAQDDLRGMTAPSLSIDAASYSARIAQFKSIGSPPRRRLERSQSC